MKLVKNLFALLDTNQDGCLSFREFLIGFAAFENETFSRKIDAAFRLFDPKEQGFISSVDLETLLIDAIYGLG